MPQMQDLSDGMIPKAMTYPHFRSSLASCLSDKSSFYPVLGIPLAVYTHNYPEGKKIQDTRLA